ncbi:MAG: hypothetical protein KHZ05_14740, partial [Oscillospiraceae bacterium]|nr:hypothetical protein [Oscillospiraceae bacterium]
MNKLNAFLALLSGNFDNAEQFEAKKADQPDFPYARHVNTVCNDKISHLPADFQGAFLLEESYYTAKG